jgi:hypothetical protein
VLAIGRPVDFGTFDRRTKSYAFKNTENHFNFHRHHGRGDILCWVLWPVKVMRPMLDVNGTVVINGIQSPDNWPIIQEINALRTNEWAKFDGKAGSCNLLLEVKAKTDSKDGVRICLFDYGLEERNNRTNTSGGYSYYNQATSSDIA